MGLTRRDFLQRSGWAIAALGLSEAGLVALVDRYGQALALPTRRKLALLVGINQYPESVCDFAAKGSALMGCLTDVELQRQLLIHRFGFLPADILTLTDEQATRTAIATAFQTHLIDQAQSGDGVVIHISGLGSQVRSSHEPSLGFNTIVPIDGVLPTDEQSPLNDLMLDTLGLLVRSLPTTQVTTILDLSYAPSGTPLQGTLRGRSRPNAPTGQIAPAELALQAQLRSRLSRAQTAPQTPFPGALLMAADDDQIALEGQWSGFSAGLFTYALTQALWDAAPAQTLRWVFHQTGSTIQTLAGSDQTPTLSGQTPQNFALSVGTSGAIAPSADGVIISTAADSQALQIWAGGLAAPLLECYGAGSRLIVAGDDPQVLRVQGRQGLVLEAVLEERAVNAIANVAAASAIAPPGQLVQEWVRLIPRQVNLSMALDSSLERIERVDATSAFTAAKVALVNPDEASADYLFGKTIAPTLAATLTATLAATLPANLAAPDPLLPTKASFGLFYPGRSALPDALFAADEAVKTAVNRLSPYLRSLQALKLLRLTQNATSSRLSVGATLECLTPQPKLLAQQFSLRTMQAPAASKNSPTTGSIPLIAPGSQIQYRLQNYGDRPLYCLFLSLDSAGRAIALPVLSAAAGSLQTAASTLTANASASSATEAATFSKNSIQPNAVLTLPQDLTNSTWTVQGSPRRVETYLILSLAPFTNAAALLQAPPSGGTLQLSNPLQVVHAVLQDLHAACTANTADKYPADAYALDVNCWATLGFAYQVTNKLASFQAF